jgi:hypothetical protein
MGHWRKNHETASNDLRSADLYDDAASKRAGRDVYASPIVQIEKVVVGKVKSREKPNGERRNYAHFVGKAKPLGLNVTNCETIQSLSGSPDTDRWAGLTIQLYVDPAARYPSGKKGPAIRIRPTLPKGQADTSPLPDVPTEARERLENEHDERLEGEPGEEG